MTLFFLLIPLISGLGFTCLLSRQAKIEFTFALPIVASCLVIILYICAMLNGLYNSTIIIYTLGFLSAGYYLFTLKKEEKQKILIYKSEILFFILINFLFIIFAKNASLASWDDFSHWGIISKEILFYNRFEDQNLQTSIFKMYAHYPRGSAIYHYFMLLFAGYSEGGVLIAHFILHIIFLAPLFGNKNFWHSFITISSIFMIVVFYTTGLRSIYNDSTVGLMFGCILTIYILENNKDKALILILPILTLLPFFREIGWWLAEFASFIIIVNYYQTYKRFNFVFILLLLMPCVASYLWIYYFKLTHDFFGRIEHSIFNIFTILESFNEKHSLLLVSYAKSFFKFLQKEGSLATYLLAVLTWFELNRYNKKLTEEYKNLMISSFVCFLLFSLWRLYLYFFTFPYGEAIKGASLLRYLGCYCFVFGMISFAYLKRSAFQFSKDKIGKNIFVILLIVSLGISLFNIKRIQYELTSYEDTLNKQSNSVRSLILNGFDVRYNFMERKTGHDCLKINYKLSPNGNKISKICLSNNSDFNFDRVDYNLISFDDININDLNKNNTIVYFAPFIGKLEYWVKK